jgi:hypothetical protein
MTSACWRIEKGLSSPTWTDSLARTSRYWMRAKEAPIALDRRDVLAFLNDHDGGGADLGSGRGREDAGSRRFPLNARRIILPEHLQETQGQRPSLAAPHLR